MYTSRAVYHRYYIILGYLITTRLHIKKLIVNVAHQLNLLLSMIWNNTTHSIESND